MQRETERHVRAALPSLRACWTLMLAAAFAWAWLGVLASPAGASPAGTAARVPAAIAAFGALCAVATAWLDRTLLAPGRLAGLLPAPDHELARRHLLVGHLALWSLAALPALLGFAQVLLGGTRGTHLALCAVSVAVLAALLPTRARIAARMEALTR